MNNEFHIGRGVNMDTSVEARNTIGVRSKIIATAGVAQPDMKMQENCTLGQHQRVASFGSYSLGGLSDIIAVPGKGEMMVRSTLKKVLTLIFVMIKLNQIFACCCMYRSPIMISRSGWIRKKGHRGSTEEGRNKFRKKETTARIIGNITGT